MIQGDTRRAIVTVQSIGAPDAAGLLAAAETLAAAARLHLGAEATFAIADRERPIVPLPQETS